jgi:hypothetical protein
MPNITIPDITIRTTSDGEGYVHGLAVGTGSVDAAIAALAAGARRQAGEARELAELPAARSAPQGEEAVEFGYGSSEETPWRFEVTDVRMLAAAGACGARSARCAARAHAPARRVTGRAGSGLPGFPERQRRGDGLPRGRAGYPIFLITVFIVSAASFCTAASACAVSREFAVSYWSLIMCATSRYSRAWAAASSLLKVASFAAIDSATASEMLSSTAAVDRDLAASGGGNTGRPPVDHHGL